MLIHLVARVALGLLLVLLAAGRASAQFEFTGSWAPIGTEDVQNDSLPVDFIGLALTEDGRALLSGFATERREVLTSLLDELSDDELDGLLRGARALRLARERRHAQEDGAGTETSH